MWCVMVCVTECVCVCVCVVCDGVCVCVGGGGGGGAPLHEGSSVHVPFIVHVATCGPKRKKPRRQLKGIELFQEMRCGPGEPEVHLSRCLRW